MTIDDIKRALAEHGSKTAAAQALGIPRSTLRGYLDRDALSELRDAQQGYRRHFEVHQGEFDEVPLSLDYLRRRYEGEVSDD